MAKGRSYLDLLTSLRKGPYAPLYLFHGEEPFFIDNLARTIEENALEESERAFNQSVVYGRDVDARGLRDMAARAPMMAPRQVIIVREAQDMKSLPDLEAYVEHPVPSTVLVLCHKHKKIDGRSKVAKALAQQGVVFESKCLYDNEVPGWVSDWCRHIGHPAPPEAVSLLTELLGNQLGPLINEIDKLVLNLEPGQPIQPDQVRASVGLSREFNVFELQSALGKRQVEAAFRIQHQMGLDPKANPIQMVIGSLFAYFLKIYTLQCLPNRNEKEMMAAIGVFYPVFFKEYIAVANRYSRVQVEGIVGILHAFDLRSKGVDNRTAGDADLLKELVHQILAA